MFPGIYVSSLPFLIVINISFLFGEMGLHSKLEGQPVQEGNKTISVRVTALKSLNRVD